MLVALLAFAWLTAHVAPETSIGASLRRWLVVAPAAWANRVTRGQVLLAALFALLLGVVAWLGQDAAAMAAQGSPELLAALGSVEASVWLDTLAGAVIAWSGTRTIGVARRLRTSPPAVRARRTRRPGARRPAANDEDGPVRGAA